jgi:hypothetical protein
VYIPSLFVSSQPPPFRSKNFPRSSLFQSASRLPSPSRPDTRKSRHSAYASIVSSYCHPQSPDQEPKKGCKKEKDRCQKKDKRERPACKDAEITVRNHQGLTERDLQLRTQHKCQKERRPFVGPLPHGKPQNAKQKHYPDIKNGIIDRIHARNAEQHNER